MTLMTFKTLRHFPAEAILMGLLGMGVLSWTEQVENFRLGIPPLYEHIIAYALLGLTLMAAKGKARLALGEIVFIILMAACLEALKAEVPFRHPKLSDFYADMIGLTISIACAAIMRMTMRMITMTAKRPIRIAY